MPVGISAPIRLLAMPHRLTSAGLRRIGMPAIHMHACASTCQAPAWLPAMTVSLYLSEYCMKAV